MTIKHGKETGVLNLSRLKLILSSKRLVCLVGYGLSEEAGIPHFHDILNGVWSSAPRNIDPFDGGYGRTTVVSWFDWRRQLINKKDRSGYFQAFLELKHSLKNMLVATQIVDGQLRLAGLQDVRELYGNIFKGRCCKCGIEGEISERIVCVACGGRILPDVSMFGWNQKTEALQTVQFAVSAAEAIILVGTDPSLAPLQKLYATNYTCQILEVVPTGFSLSDQSIRLKATTSDLSDQLKKEHGIHVPPPGGHSIIVSLKFLSLLVKEIQRGEQPC